VSVAAGAPPALDLDQSFARDGRVKPRASDGDRLTLGSKLTSVWEGLLAAGVAVCPVCASRMERASDGALCTRCASTLS